MMEEHCETGFLALKFHILHHPCEDFKRIGSAGLVDESAYEHINLVFKRGYQRTSMKRSSRMQESSCALQSNIMDLQGKEKDEVSKT